MPARYRIERKGHVWYGLSRNRVVDRLWETALAATLLGDAVYERKAADFLRSIADPNVGYPTTRWATDSTAFVHEGEFFTFYSAAYDLMYDKLSDADRELVDATLRLYLDTCEPWHDGSIGNWQVTANVGAILTSLVLQDMVKLGRLINGRGGFIDQISSGIMGDGWWQEGASNYSYLVARYYGYAAEACRNWGLDLYHLRVPWRFGGDNREGWKNGWMGMSFEQWGPPGNPYRGIKDLYDGAIPMMDEHGWVVANNDSAKKPPEDVYELAYFRYRDDVYPWIIARTQRSGWQSLVWGVADLPESEDPRARSAHVDNVGITALRSQTPGRTPEDQIQTYVKWGTHGGWHGHFDRTSLLALDRFGTEFFSPLASWFRYESPMYKAWVQPSISHDMVVVDGLQQEPVPTKQLLFYAGEALQASVVETGARWAQKPPWDLRNPGDLDPLNSAKMIDYGTFEPVIQRRLTVVTDDYVVIADCLQAPVAHTFDWLMHPAGFANAKALSMSSTKRTERLSDDPESSYYFVTDCRWFTARTPMVHSFEGCDTKLNIHTVWPRDLEGTVGVFPAPTAEVRYGVTTDGEYAADGEFVVHQSQHLWAPRIDVDVTDCATMTVTISVEMRDNFAARRCSLVDPHFLTEDGEVVALGDLEFDVSVASAGTASRAPIGGPHNGRARSVELSVDGPTTLRVDIGSLGVTRFLSGVDVDARVREEVLLRRTLLLRESGTQARFLNVLEPFRGEPVVAAVEASGPDSLLVTLADGRAQSIEISGLCDGADICVRMQEYRHGVPVRDDSTL